VTYSFDKNHTFECLRLSLPKVSPALPSISSAFGCAFTYENEMHDLFGIAVSGLNVDFGGNFYRTSVKTPFMVEPKPAAAAAAAPKPATAG
jgi:ech hydrogenase subunit D